MPALTLHQIKKSFGKTAVLHGIDLSVDEGEFVVFVGPSGCGKSTLLRLIAGLEAADAGSIHFGGRELTHAPPSQRQVAMVFQSYALYPHMTVRQNLSFGMRMRGVPRSTIDAKLAQAVRVLQLEPYLERKPGELSGGQCQRVAIGRALVQEPAVFLFDEPLSNLDAELRLHMRVEIKSLHQQLGKTMVYVTHDQLEAMTLADRIVVLRAGRIEQQGAPLALYERPANVFVAGFIGSPAMNLFPADFNAGQATLADGSALKVAADVAGPGTLGVRPEHLRVDAEGPLLLHVQVVEALGATRYVHGLCAGQPACAELRDGAAPRPGATLRLTPTQLHVFDAAGQRVPSAADGRSG
jgi:ABC-type sugar transport system ATPase subunit